MTGGGDGERPPRVRLPPPGPASRRLAERLAVHEPPGINTLYGGEPSLAWAEARGVNVTDLDGNLYLDLTAGFGVAAVGHRHPAVTAAVAEQSTRLIHGLGDVHAHPARAALAQRLAARAPVAGVSAASSPTASDAVSQGAARRGGSAAAPGEAPAGESAETAQVYFAVSGADAVEIALETALLATGRPGVVAFDPGYHGLTLGARSVTSRPAFRRPFAPWLSPHVHRLPYGCPPERLEALLGAVRDVGCLVVEPLVGREGVVVPPPGWLAAVAAICRRLAVLLIADEVFTGFGRTGSWFAVEHEGVRPDLLVCGKALGGGLPIAAVVGRRRLMAAWATPGEALHTATFVAQPLACAAALAVLDLLEEGDLPGRAAALGETVGRRLAAWPQRFEAVTEVRGRGLLWGVELTDREAAHRLVSAAMGRGVLLLAGGPEGRVAQIVPPLNIPEHLLELALDLLEQALAEL